VKQLSLKWIFFRKKYSFFISDWFQILLISENE
jgi:hypothetical protein